MAITREKKSEIVEDLANRFSKSKSIVFLCFKGLKAKENVELRRKLGSENIDCKVAKKTLIKMGLKRADIEKIDDSVLEGPVAVAVGYEDEVAPARIAGEFSKANNNLRVLGGVLSGRYLKAEEMKVLAALPDKNQLRAQFIRSVNAPVSGLVNILSISITNFINVVEQIKSSRYNSN